MRLLLCMLLTCLCGPAVGAETAEVLTLTLKSGQQVSFELSKRPEVTFAEEKLTIKAEEAQVEYTFAEIDGFGFETIETGIRQLRNGEVRFRATGAGEWTVDGCQGQMTVSDLSGKQCLVVSHTADGHAVLSLASLPAGVYIVNIGSETFKIVKP